MTTTTTKVRNTSEHVLETIIQEIQNNIDSSYFMYEGAIRISSSEIYLKFPQYKHGFLDKRINDIYSDYELLTFEYENFKENMNNLDVFEYTSLKLNSKNIELLKSYIKDSYQTFDGYRKITHDNFKNIDYGYNSCKIRFLTSIDIDSLYNDVSWYIDNKKVTEYKKELNNILKFSKILKKACAGLYEIYSSDFDYTSYTIDNIHEYILENDTKNDLIINELNHEIIDNFKTKIIDYITYISNDTIGTNSVYHNSYELSKTKSIISTLKNDNISYTGKNTRHEELQKQESNLIILQKIADFKDKLNIMTSHELLQWIIDNKDNYKTSLIDTVLKLINE